MDNGEEGSGARRGNSERRSEDVPRRTQLGAGCRRAPLGQVCLEKAFLRALPTATPHKISQIQAFWFLLTYQRRRLHGAQAMG